MKTVPTLASELNKKPTKAEVFKVVQRNINLLDTEDAALLYAFFIPAITKVKNPFHWCVKARGRKDVRAYLNHVYSDGERTLASDGHRVHIIGVTRASGWYDDNEQLIHAADWARYPDINRVLPTDEGVPLDLSSLEVVQGLTGIETYRINAEYGVRVQYVKEALQLSGSGVVTWHKGAKILQIRHPAGLAAIMFTRLKKAEK